MLRYRHRHLAALAAHGHDERFPRRGQHGRVAGARRQLRVSRLEPRIAPVSLDMERAPAATLSDEGLAGLHPAYFALVMATGIVSIAAHLLEIPIIPQTLFALNALFYPALWVLTIARVWRHRA